MSTSTEVEVPNLTFDQARALTDRIKSGIDAVWQDYLLAFTMKVWEPLDYPSFDAWSDAELKGARAMRLNRDQRREIGKAAREQNLSTRQIADALGVHHSTVADDLRSTVGNPPVATVVGRDGKQRAATRPALAVVPDPEEDVVDAEIIEEDEVPQGPHPTDGMTARQRNKTEHHGLEWRVNVLRSFDQQVGELNDLSDGTVTADDLHDWLKIVTAHQGGAARFKKYLTTQLKNLEDTAP